jgi:hypothetical protein
MAASVEDRAVDLVQAAEALAVAARDDTADAAGPAALDRVETALGALATATATIGISGLARRALDSPQDSSDEAFLQASRRLGDLHGRLLSAQRACRAARKALSSGPTEAQARAPLRGSVEPRVPQRGSVVWFGRHRARW